MADGFAIYYDNSLKDKDRSFPRAAATWKADFEAGNGYRLCYPNPRTFMERALSEADFVAAWIRLSERAAKEKLTFVEGRVFSHASTGSLEFIGGGESDGTLSLSEIKTLPVLPWAEGAVLVLHGCRTGQTGNKGRAAGREFADTQKIHTVGQAGYAYFSKSPKEYKVISATSSPTYLWAYDRGWSNNIFGSGGAMRGVDFYP